MSSRLDLFPTNEENSTYISHNFKEIDHQLEQMNIYLLHLDNDDYNDNKIKQSETYIKRSFDLIFDNWKLIKKQQFDLKNFKKIKEYKNILTTKLGEIKKLLIHHMTTSNCRNSTSTIESKTIFNTRRETQGISSEIRNNSIVVRESIFLNDNLTAKIVEKRQSQIKYIDSVIQELDKHKFEREFSFFNYISERLIIDFAYNNEQFEEKKVLTVLIFIVVGLFIILVLKKKVNS